MHARKSRALQLERAAITADAIFRSADPSKKVMVNRLCFLQVHILPNIMMLWAENTFKILGK